MSSTDFRQLSTKELHLYMNLVMGFCKDIRRMLREGTLTKDAIDKYEVTVSNNILTEVNRRSGGGNIWAAVRARAGASIMYPIASCLPKSLTFIPHRLLIFGGSAPWQCPTPHANGSLLGQARNRP